MKNLLISAVVLVGFVYGGAAKADYDLTCESSNGQTRTCPINDSAGNVYLKTQLSRSGCYEGSTWGSYDNSVWVSNGCRAVFRVSENNYNTHGNRYYSNESTSNGKAAAAAAAVVIGAVAVAAAANHNNNHGSYNQNDYSNRYGNNYNNYGNNSYNYGNNYNYDDRRITCESQGKNRQRCATHIGRGTVQISRKLSNSSCRFGQDWNYDNKAIYVWNGCRAVFTIY
ncbi:MAG: DUF3011 domain-containing protein [Arenimonas sp.]|nr:DUF3011 domain-containing protein [Arenimonas sp.]